MESFQLSKILIKKIAELILAKKNTILKKLVNEIHFADMAEIINELSEDQGIYLIKLFDSEKTSEILTELDEDVREKILEGLSVKEIADEIEELDSDDAADILAELSEERKEEVISKISDDNLADDLKELLSYNEDSAGGLMAKELVKANENWSVLKCLSEIKKQGEKVTRVHSIYVVDDKEKLIGRLSLKDLITSPSKSKIKNIYIPKVDSVNVLEKGEDVAKIMSKYDLEAIPVVDDKTHLVGRITIDDIVDFIKEEAEEDYLIAAGIQGDVEADDSIFELTKARLPWLFLGLVGGLGSVFILEGFEEFMNNPSYKALFFFTPLIAAMAGNVGVQSSAIIVQGLANDVVKGSLLNRLIKELGLSLINGVILGLLTIVFGQVINQPIELSLVISLSMLCVIVVAALIGTSIPIILEKRGIDPAIATGPFITTSNDIFGIFLFFYIAKIFLL
ncbi:MAG: magnesium transporter [Flavobacteriaceae bacterium]|jgi:magnesium transporter|nr:magnesium transporter [Flavobacteriaceae bacterium]MBT3753702.1 magnesium transporter [Flavobacteriaceae bacterium]MBT3794529.1 magnesium transporter [Flavobacteriaceae bacterium]MBT4415644.1 magnesium transporter [Flavobacteriaceae bacterium]MBT5396190.1 magnesium transporter [Flavobacteriaceae bacterium]